MTLFVSRPQQRRMPTLLMLGVFLVLAILVPGTRASATPVAAPSFDIALDLVASDLNRPVQVVTPDEDAERLFIVEQSGRIRIVRNGRVLPESFLDLSELVSCCGERGLLSVAFHPDYAHNGLFFVDYTDTNGDTMIARYQVSDDNPDRADSASATTILTVEQPASNHNGGLLLFGPNDGYLYVGLGDGGGGNGQNGQDLSTLLGKLLRLDVDRTSGDRPYAIPPDNPFASQPDARPEIWALGLRNPWRFSFDRATGDLWIGDVGSGSYEEINYQPAASPGGENYGWNLMEGTACRADADCDAFVTPVAGFDHGEGCVVTGGYVYRGAANPALSGVYLFADYCSGKVWGVAPDDAAAWRVMGPVETGLRISSFGEDQSGELYLVDLGGAIHRLRAV